MTLSDQDRKLLTILQADGRISNQELADAAAMSASACWRRVKYLEDKGIVRRYAALVDASKVGKSFHALVHVELSRHERGGVDRFVAAVGGRDEVLDCFATTGDADYYLRVLCTDLNAYNDFLENFLFRLPAIAKVRTNLVLKDIKHETALAL